MATNNNVDNVSAGKPKIGGSIYTAPLGTTLPTDSTTALDNAFENVGYISDEGLNNEISRTTEDIKSWGGNIVLSSLTEYKETYGFTMIESANKTALGVVYNDDNVSGDLTTGLAIRRNSADLQYKSYIVEMMLRDGGTRRLVIPKAKPVEIGTINYTDGDVIGYPVTLGANPDTNGNCSYEYLKAKAA